MHCFTTIFLICIVFYIAIIPYIAIVDDLAPQVDLISSIKMTPLTPTQHPYIRDLMISIKVFGKLVVELKKTLGWENTRKSFENGFENLGVVSTPLKCFLNDFSKNGIGLWKKRSWWFYKKTLVFLCSQSEQLTRANTLPQYGTGLSPKFICFSAGSLILYKGL
jgi:hypothetical protein